MTESIYNEEELKLLDLMDDIQERLESWRLSTKYRAELTAALQVIEKLVIYHFLQRKYPEQFSGTFDRPSIDAAHRYLTHAGAK